MITPRIKLPMLSFLLFVAICTHATNILAAGRAHSDAEIVLQIASTTPGATLSMIGSGIKQVGPTSSTVYDSLNRLRIAGVFPANSIDVPMSVGQKIEIDIQAGVRTNPLANGESAELQIDIFGNLNIQNTGLIDAVVTFDFEREYFLTALLDDPSSEFGQAHGEFEMVATSFNTVGDEVDDFSLVYGGTVRNGLGSAGPQDHFNFDLIIPAGGNGSVQMHALALSRVALVPEPGAGSILVAASLALSGCWRSRPAGDRGAHASGVARESRGSRL